MRERPFHLYTYIHTYIRTHVDTHPILFIRQELTNVMQDEQADISDPDAA